MHVCFLHGNSHCIFLTHVKVELTTRVARLSGVAGALLAKHLIIGDRPNIVGSDSAVTAVRPCTSFLPAYVMPGTQPTACIPCEDSKEQFTLLEPYNV
jgi:hypothetical protein